MTLYLHGLGHFHPENEITNRFLEELDIGTNDAWILERVGIRSRRTVLPLDYIRDDAQPRPARGAVEADALHATPRPAGAPPRWRSRAPGIDRSDIGMVIAGSSAPDTVDARRRPATSPRALGIEVPALRRELRLHELLRAAPPALDDATRRRCRDFVLLGRARGA